LVIFITLVAALIASLAQVLFKKGLPAGIRKISHFVMLIKNKLVLSGICLYALSLALYLYALESAALSVVYPIFASTFIFVVITSALVLGEKISWKRGGGVLLVFIGVVIIAVSAV
jgi:drug/metabolite transporter (DMT)-like permease